MPNLDKKHHSSSDNLKLEKYTNVGKKKAKTHAHIISSVSEFRKGVSSDSRRRNCQKPPILKVYTGQIYSIFVHPPQAFLRAMTRAASSSKSGIFGCTRTTPGQSDLSEVDRAGTLAASPGLMDSCGSETALPVVFKEPFC